MSETMCWKIKLIKFVAVTLGVCTIMVGICLESGQAEIVDRVLAFVNDDIILLSDTQESMSVLQAALQKQGYAVADQKRILDGKRRQVLEQLIHEKLADQQVHRHKLKVSDSDVDATIGRIRNANKLSEEEFRRAMELDGMPYETYRRQIKEKILRARLVDREVKSKIVITETEIKSYYDNHIDRYAGSTRYDLRHILVKMAPGGGEAAKAHALEQTSIIRQRLQAGEPFEKMANLFSDAPTASKGGRLGVFGTHLLTEDIRSALEGLQPKQFSPVVESDQGFQIFYIEDVIQTGGTTLEAASDEIREKLYADVVDQKYKTWIKMLRENSHIEVLE